MCVRYIVRSCGIICYASVQEILEQSIRFSGACNISANICWVAHSVSDIKSPRTMLVILTRVTYASHTCHILARVTPHEYCVDSVNSAIWHNRTDRIVSYQLRKYDALLVLYKKIFLYDLLKLYSI